MPATAQAPTPKRTGPMAAVKQLTVPVVVIRAMIALNRAPAFSSKLLCLRVAYGFLA